MRDRCNPITPILPPSERDLARHDQRVGRRLDDTHNELTQQRRYLAGLTIAFILTALTAFVAVSLLAKG